MIQKIGYKKYKDQRTQEELDHVSFLFNSKTLDVLSFGNDKTMRLLQKSYFIKDHTFFPILKAFSISEVALNDILSSKSLKNYLDEKCKIKANLY